MDYLSRYTTQAGFDIPKLLNDDFFVPIKLLFNNAHYVSATKLLLVFIDTMSFLESGRSDANGFQAWLDRYVDLGRLGVSSRELWDYRNGLLHMSNLNSRRTESGEVARLIAYVGELPPSVDARELAGHEMGKRFSLFGLIQALAAGVEKQIGVMNADRPHLLRFAERYDLVVSDARMLRVTGRLPHPSAST